jgi:transcriptional regulator with XRE-family HTH domain
MGNKNRKASPEILWLLAINLRRLRKARGYTQVELARRSGLPNRYISNIEQELKNVTLANLEALAKGLDCSLVDLFLQPTDHAPSEDP